MVSSTTDRGKASSRELPPRMAELLRAGNADDPENALWSVVLSMVQHGWSRSEMERALRDRRNRAGGRYRTREREQGEAAAGQLLDKRIESARTYAKENPPVGDRAEALAEAVRIRSAADAHSWPGRTGSNDRVVLDGLVRLAALGGGVRFRASHRQIVEATGLSRPTVASSLGRLQEAGWLRSEQPGSHERGSTWSLRAPALVTWPVPRRGMTTGQVTLVSLTDGSARADRDRAGAGDVFRRGCLPMSAARVLVAVVNAEDPMTAAQVAADLGVSVSTVRKALVNLESAGVVDRAAESCWVPATRDLDEMRLRLDRLAAWRGTAGKAEDVRDVHVLTRAGYADKLARKQRERMRLIAGGRSAKPAKKRDRSGRKAAAAAV